MPYRGGELTDLAPPLERATRRLGRDATEQIGEDLKRRVRRHTPVAKQTPEIRASYGSREEWIVARGREPGTLRDSWIVGEVKMTRGTRYSVPVLTYDPVAPNVEWETSPHFIVPKRAQRLTIPTVGGMVLSGGVEHPGTRGAHMMAIAIAEIASSWQGIASREWAQIARRVWEE